LLAILVLNRTHLLVRPLFTRRHSSSKTSDSSLSSDSSKE
jgi:hypothetical protein